MQCSNCGVQNRLDAHFCRQCGQSLAVDLPVDSLQPADWLPVTSSDALGIPSRNLVRTIEIEGESQSTSLVPVPSDKMQKALVSTKRSLSIQRPGCDYCFQATNSYDEDETHRALVKCSQCGVLYHQSCWEQIEECLRCTSSEVASIELAPPLLYARNKNKSIPITPTAVTYSFGEMGFALPNSVMEFLGWYYKTISRVIEKLFSHLPDNTPKEFLNFIRGNSHLIVPITVFGISIIGLMIPVCLCALLVMIF